MTCPPSVSWTLSHECVALPHLCSLWLLLRPLFVPAFLPGHPAPSPCLPAALLQVSPTQLRGTLGSINQLLICIGILAALLVNVALPAASWRSMFWLAALPAVALGLGK